MEIERPTNGGETSGEEHKNLDRRFKLSEKDFAVARMKGLREAIREAQTENPEILSACIYGSMVQGTAHEKSDIDTYVYVDVESRTENPDEYLERDGNTTYLKNDKEYKSKIITLLEAKTDLSAEELEKDIRIRPLSESIIDQDLSMYATTAYHELQHKKLQEELAKKVDSGEVELFSEEYSRLNPEPLGNPLTIANSFSSLFHLETGGGIGKYRHMVLEKLDHMGEEGGLIWENVASNLRTFERNYETKEMSDFPNSLDDALRIYHKEYYQEKKKREDEERINAIRGQLQSLY